MTSFVSKLNACTDRCILQLASGNILGVTTAAELTTAQCLSIGQMALQRKEYTSAIPWFELTIEKIKLDKFNKPNNITVEDVQQLIETTAMKVC